MEAHNITHDWHMTRPTCTDHTSKKNIGTRTLASFPVWEPGYKDTRLIPSLGTRLQRILASFPVWEPGYKDWE